MADWPPRPPEAVSPPAGASGGRGSALRFAATHGPGRKRLFSGSGAQQPRGGSRCGPSAPACPVGIRLSSRSGVTLQTGPPSKPPSQCQSLGPAGAPPPSPCGVGRDRSERLGPSWTQPVQRPGGVPPARPGVPHLCPSPSPAGALGTVQWAAWALGTFSDLRKAALRLFRASVFLI